MFEYNHFITLVTEHLVAIDPESEACRGGELAIYEMGAVLLGCYNYGMSAEDAALFLLASETLLPN